MTGARVSIPSTTVALDKVLNGSTTTSDAENNWAVAVEADEVRPSPMKRPSTAMRAAMSLDGLTSLGAVPWVFNLLREAGKLAVLTLIMLAKM
jgi:hypothetical protein